MAFSDFLVTFFCLNKKFLVYNFIGRNLKVKYRRSFFGILWTLMAPLSLALVYFTVFKLILKVDREYYLLLVVTGVLTWNFFAQTVTESLSHYVDLQALVTKIYFPLQVLNLSTTTTNGLNLVFSLPILLAVMAFYGRPPTHHLLLLPVYFVCLGLFTYSSSIVVAWLFVFFRDLRQMISILLQLLFYGTPVLYTLDMVPAKYQPFFAFNPLAVLIQGIQDCFLGVFRITKVQGVSLALWLLVMVAIAGYLAIKKRTPVVENL